MGLLLKDATIVDFETGTTKVSNLWIHNKKIWYTPPSPNEKFTKIDLSGKLLFPGMVDLRCHLRDASGKNCESIKSGSLAAVSGGYTSLLTMPNISPQPDNPGAIRFIKESAEKNSACKIHIVGCLTIQSKGLALAPLGSIKESGIIAVSDCPFSTQDNEVFVKAVEYATMFNLPVIEFPRENTLSKNGNAHDGLISLGMGLGGYPRMAEELFVQRAITVSKNLDAQIHLTSISSKGSVELIREAKAKEVRVTADVTPHHLCFTDESIRGYNTNFKTMPPLREKEDKEALIDGLIDGTIDCICSGHEPFSEHLKNSEFDIAPSGVISLETAFISILNMYSEKIRNLPLLMSKWTALNPSKILGLTSGTLKEGSAADILVYNPDYSWNYEAKKGYSFCSNSPFDDNHFNGCVEMTLVDGRIMYKRQ